MPCKHTLSNRLDIRLEALRKQGLHRSPSLITHRSGKHIFVDAKPLINFASNDYLGLATCPQWQQTVARCFANAAPSASSSRLVTGNLSAISEKEAAFAELFGYDDCLFFPSGYQANQAVLRGLLHAGSPVFFDKRIHASMAEALSQTNARLAGFAHNNLQQLVTKLRRSSQTESTECIAEQPVILLESLYSMDGDSPDFLECAKIQKDFDAFCIVDEAHAIGALGKKGKGIASSIADITVGTLGKALGLFGAFALLPNRYKEFLSNFASPVMYSTAMPEAFADCALAAMHRVLTMDMERERLSSLSTLAKKELQREGFIVHGNAHILAVEIGNETKTTELAKKLYENGIFVFAARYPTVPQNKAVIRISMTALHSASDIEKLVIGMREEGK